MGGGLCEGGDSSMTAGAAVRMLLGVTWRKRRKHLSAHVASLGHFTIMLCRHFRNMAQVLHKLVVKHG